jgi:hypothetical protein
MDRLTKIRIYCETELQRLDIAVLLARDKYQQTLNAFDLADYHNACRKKEICSVVFQQIVDIIQYCSDT